MLQQQPECVCKSLSSLPPLFFHGELVRESVTKILDRLYLGHEPFELSSGWLEAFKSRHGFRFYRCFGESGFVNMATLANTLPAIRDVLDQYAWKDIYNMDETRLLYQMQVL
jgi:hypothetical protein